MGSEPSDYWMEEVEEMEMCEERERGTVSPEEFESTIRALGPLKGLTAEGWAEFTRVVRSRPWDSDSQDDMLSLFQEVHGRREEDREAVD